MNKLGNVIAQASRGALGTLMACGIVGGVLGCGDSLDKSLDSKASTGQDNATTSGAMPAQGSAAVPAGGDYAAGAGAPVGSPVSQNAGQNPAGAQISQPGAAPPAGDALIAEGESAPIVQGSPDPAAAVVPAPAMQQPEVVVEPAEPIDATSIATNPFVDTTHDPLSTFAADVDTASYDIFRRDVERGVLPSPTSVRLEEFVNYFDYDYPAPEQDAEQPFSIALAAAPNLIDNGTTLLRVGIQGKLPPPFEKRPANLVFLIDTSGSMQSAEKLPLVQRVLSRTVSILDPADTVSIVTYASGTGVALAPTPASDAETITAVINGLSAAGSTNGAGGIQLAYEQARSAYLEGGINHVILATDGDFNVGVSSDSELVALIEEERRGGITLTALGFGTQNNDSMMEAVSNAGNGVYGVISSETQADRYVDDRMLHNLDFIAKDMKIQVEFNPEHVQAYRLLGYENRAIADNQFRDDLVDAGEVGAGHRVTALYELVLSDASMPDVDGAPPVETGDAYDGEVEVDPSEFVLVKVRYKDVDATATDAAYETSAALMPEDVASSPSDLDDDFQWAVAVAAFAEILKSSPYANMANMGSIDAVIRSQADRDEERAEFITLFEMAQSLLDNGAPVEPEPEVAAR